MPQVQQMKQPSCHCFSIAVNNFPAVIGLEQPAHIGESFFCGLGGSDVVGGDFSSGAGDDVPAGLVVPGDCDLGGAEDLEGEDVVSFTG